MSLKHPSFTRLDCCWAVTHLTRRPCRPDFGVATEVSKSYSRRRLQLSVERVCSTTQRLRAVEDNASAALLRCRQRRGCQISLERENQASWESFGITDGRCLADGEQQLRVEPFRSISVLRTFGIGATLSLPRVPAKVPSPNPQQPFALSATPNLCLQSPRQRVEGVP